MKQQSFASLSYQNKKKQTRRETFLGEMDQVVPWARLLKRLSPYYRQAPVGRKRIGLEVQLRIYFLQQWYGLSDPAAEEALYDIESMRRFAGLELDENAIPDETTILNFRHLLEAHGLTSVLFEEVKEFLEEKKLLLSAGSILDATIIHAPSSTKNRDKRRDPEMSSTKKGNAWYFGMKAHISVDAQSGLTHTVGATTAKVHDAKVIKELIREKDRAVFADKGYFSDQKKKEAREAGIFWGVLDKAKPRKKLSASQNRRNKKLSSIRAKVEHPFRILKCQFGYRKTRYRGINKNGAQLFSLFALANLYQVRKQLLAGSG